MLNNQKFLVPDLRSKYHTSIYLRFFTFSNFPAPARSSAYGVCLSHVQSKLILLYCITPLPFFMVTSVEYDWVRASAMLYISIAIFS